MKRLVIFLLGCLLILPVLAKATGYQDMPLTLVPSTKKNNLPLIFMISGDGGWTSFDQALAESLAAKGFSVLGLDAQKYFWKVKTPEKTTADISKALEHYLEQLSKTSFILSGYSFGASLTPFVANRLPANLKVNMKGVIVFSPDAVADFEIHVLDLFNFGSSKYRYDVIAEMKKISGITPVSIFGSSEAGSVKNKFIKNGLKVINIPGNHHFDREYEIIAAAFLKQLGN